MSRLPNDVLEYVRSQIKRLDDELFEVQQAIWNNPEIMYEEHFAHATLTSFMEKQPGWAVTKHAFGLETAFECVLQHKPEKNPAIISFNSEFDALPKIGHACGHNLIAICGVTAALSTALAMAKFDIPGTVKLIGTPAEESGGGKIKLLDAGAFDNVDVSLMAHPFNEPTKAVFLSNANQRFKLEYFGKEAHAAASPWQGVNALDAMVMMYNAVSVLRQQLLPEDIVQCHISEGGHAPNIITGYSSATFAVRAKTLSRLREVQTKVINCAKAGALATGCKYKITWLTNYYNMIPNDVLADRYRAHMNEVFGCSILPLEEDRRTGRFSGSTDQGNVSWKVPSLHPMFHIDSPVGPHTKDFTAAAKLRSSHQAAVETGMSLGFTGLELLKDPELLAQVKDQFKKDIAVHKAEVSSAPEPVVDLDTLKMQ